MKIGDLTLREAEEQSLSLKISVFTFLRFMESIHGEMAAIKKVWSKIKMANG